MPTLNTNININFKKLVGVSHTSNTSEYYSEVFPTTLFTKSDTIWSSSPPSDPSQAITEGLAEEVNVQCSPYETGVSGTQKVFIITDVYQDTPNDFDNLNTHRLTDFISPSFGADYVIKMFSDASFTTSVPFGEVTFLFDYQSGVLYFESGLSEDDLYVKLYRYTGEFLSDTLEAISGAAMDSSSAVAIVEQTITDNLSAGNYVTSLSKVKGDVIPTDADTYSIGTSSTPFKSIYLSNEALYLGDDKISTSSNKILLNDTALAETFTDSGNGIIVDGSGNLKLVLESSTLEHNGLDQLTITDGAIDIDKLEINVRNTLSTMQEDISGNSDDILAETNRAVAEDSRIDSLYDTKTSDLSAFIDLEESRAISEESRLETITENISSALDNNFSILNDTIKNSLDGRLEKGSCRVATTANITLSGIPVVDGVVDLQAGDRILVKDQTIGSENGIYVIDSGAWSRSEDADNSPDAEVKTGMFTFVSEGTSFGGNGFSLLTAEPITLDTTSLNFTISHGAGDIRGGVGLEMNGNSIDVSFDDQTIGVNGSDEIFVKDNSIEMQQLSSTIEQILTDNTTDIIELSGNLNDLTTDVVNLSASVNALPWQTVFLQDFGQGHVHVITINDDNAFKLLRGEIATYVQDTVEAGHTHTVTWGVVANAVTVTNVTTDNSHTHTFKIASGSGGDLEWNSQVPYATDALVKYNGQIFKSLQGSNTNNLPDVENSLFWAEMVQKDHYDLRYATTNTVNISGSDHMVRLNPSTYNTTAVNMPNLNDVRDGKVIVVKDSEGIAETHNITISPYSGQDIDESHPGVHMNKYVMDINKESVTFVANKSEMIWEAI